MTNIRYQTMSITALRKLDRFSMDDGLTFHVAAASRTGDTIAVYRDKARITETTVTIPAEMENCLLEVVLAEVSLAFTIEVDIARWARAYGVDRTVEAVEADVRFYFDPPWVPPHLFGTVAVKSVGRR